MRSTPLLMLGAALLAACPDEGKRPLGATCEDDGECASGLCYLGECLDPDADDDLDTLVNGLEARLGANPRNLDSDGDGKPDPLEASSVAADDADGDGRPDIVESSIADADGDCIVDELDADDAHPDGEGCVSAPVVSCDDLYRENPGSPSGVQAIDPDGAGPEPSILVECAMGLAEGGWGRLGSAWLDMLGENPRQRQYLIVAPDGRWVMSPPTSAIWDFTQATHLPGTWFTGNAAGAGDAFTCPPGARVSGVGIGCFTADGVYGSGADVDTILGGLAVCGREAFANCVAAKVYARDVRCPSDDGMLMDGELVALGRGEKTCWKVETFDDGGGGIEGNVFIDQDGARPGAAPAIRAEPYTTATYPWVVTFDHRELQFAAGRAYRLEFWARAADTRALLIESGPELEAAAEYLFVRPEWQRFEVDFVARSTSLNGLLRFHVGLVDPPTLLWLDGFALHELGGPACFKPEGDLIGDGGFTFGHSCWERVRNTDRHDGALASDADAPSMAPSLRVDQGAGEDGSTPYIAQGALAFQAGHAYQLSFNARAESARNFEIITTSAGAQTLMTQHLRGVGTSWRADSLRLWADPASGDPGEGRINFFFGIGGSGSLWLDDVHLSDLGTDPCVAAPGELVGDGGFDLGTRCWSPATPTLTAIETVESDDQSGTEPFLLAYNDPAATGEFSVSQRVALGAGEHLLTFRAFARTLPRTLPVRVIGADGKEIFANRVALGDAWKQHELRFTAPATDAGARLVFDFGGSEDAWVYLDEVHFFTP